MSSWQEFESFLRSDKAQRHGPGQDNEKPSKQVKLDSREAQEGECLVIHGTLGEELVFPLVTSGLSDTRLAGTFSEASLMTHTPDTWIGNIIYPEFFALESSSQNHHPEEHPMILKKSDRLFRLALESLLHLEDTNVLESPDVSKYLHDLLLKEAMQLFDRCLMHWAPQNMICLLDAVKGFSDKYVIS